MCWALGSGFVLASPAVESPELELDDEPELLLGLLELPELPELELPQAATTRPHVIAISANRSVLCTCTSLPR
jgi:hypothetical protein